MLWERLTLVGHVPKWNGTPWPAVLQVGFLALLPLIECRVVLPGEGYIGGGKETATVGLTCSITLRRIALYSVDARWRGLLGRFKGNDDGLQPFHTLRMQS